MSSTPTPAGASPVRFWARLPHPLRWLAAGVVGVTLVIVGIILLVLPGPGLALIALGLVVLGTEFAWARALLTRISAHGATVAGHVRTRIAPLRTALPFRTSRSARPTPSTDIPTTDIPTTDVPTRRSAA